MKRTSRVLALSFFGMLTAMAAQSSESISTFGPVDLCESQAVIHTIFNPHEYTITKHVDWIDTRSGRVIDSRSIVLLPGRGASVVYQQGRITLDADLNKMPDTCRATRSFVAILGSGDIKAQPAEVRSSVHYFEGRLLSARDLTREQSYSRRVISGVFAAENSSRAVSKPFHVEAASDITVRLMNVGHTGGAFTVEIADAITGTIVAAKTVYLDPGPDQQTPALNAFAAFKFHTKAGARIAFIAFGSFIAFRT